ncbi:MAG TPA: DUF6766 family protein [Planctomycetota bacterium]|nr:DUF6766 family protein [Planctomycetota bacterium]
MKRHFRRWGAVYILTVLFLGSWVGQFFTQLAEFRQQVAAQGEPFAWSPYLATFFSATFENWQSEWLQLLVQAVLLLAMKHLIFRADAEDMERLQSKVDALMRDRGLDVDQVEAEVELRQAE